MRKWDPKRLIPSPPLAGALFVVLLLGWFLVFAPNLIGMADNGDFERVINREGLYYVPEGEGDTEHFDYFHREFAQREYYNEETLGIFTSQELPIKLAIFLDRLFTGEDGTFDIRFYGVPHILALAAALYLLIEYLTLGMKRGVAAYLIAAMVVFLFGDLAYTAYFNSFYAEGMVLISFILTLTSALLVAKGVHSPGWMMALLLVSGVFLTTSKQQNAPMGVLIGLMLVLLPFAAAVQKRNTGNLLFDMTNGLHKNDGVSTPADQDEPDEKQERRRRLLRGKSFRGATAIGGAFLCLTGVCSYLLIPEAFVYVNQYHGMTRGALIATANPEQTLGEFDIDRQYALLAGTIYFERYPPIRVDSETLVDNFYSKYSFFSLATHYITHPDRFLQMMDAAVKSGYSPNPGYAGSYELSAGKEAGAKTSAFNLVSGLKESAVPRTVGFVIIWVIVAMALSWRDRARTLVLVTCMLAGISQLALSVITAGDADLAKHVFAYNVAFDFVNCVGFAALIRALGAWFVEQIRKLFENRKTQRQQEKQPAENVG